MEPERELPELEELDELDEGECCLAGLCLLLRVEVLLERALLLR